MTTAPAGYRAGDPALPTSPVSLDDLDALKATVLWSDDDAAALRRAGELLAPQVEEILDLWYGFVGSHPHLVATFAGADGAPNGDYLAAVRARFARWIVDVCAGPYGRAWLDWQEEIARRHTRAGKNETDGVESTSAEVPMRYLVAFVVPLTVTIKGFLAGAAAPGDDVEAMHAAWFKAITLTATLWARPYAGSSW